jgi:DNA invertase Pin-like site-specific DNA recombinase
MRKMAENLMQNNARVMREIPAMQRFGTVGNLAVMPKKLRVCAYARVSTDEEEQLTSYKAQVDYYSGYIQDNPKWEYCGIYADEGITGTSMRKRKEFMRMLDDCHAGKIDMIITKSISRFARNTVDCLDTVRKLKEIGVKVYFEKENLDSMDTTGNLMLSILSSIAEEESRSISTNIRWSVQKKFERGEVIVGHLFGYTKDETGRLEIDTEKALIVRRIFDDFIDGKSIMQICNALEADGIPTPQGKQKWCTSTVFTILQNEKYIGDAVLQKTYKQDLLSPRRVKNEGFARSFYVSNNHLPIVSREVFACAQEELKRRNDMKKNSKSGGGRYSGQYPFSTMLVCECCGANFRRGFQYSKNFKKPVWTCINHTDKHNCKMLPIREWQVEEAFVKASNQMITDKEKFLTTLKNNIFTVVKESGDTNLDDVLTELQQKQSEMLAINKRRPQTKEESEKLEQQTLMLMAEIDDLNATLQHFERTKQTVIVAEERMAKIEALLAEEANFETFNPHTFKSLVEKITVSEDHLLTFHLKCGSEIKVQA